MSIEKLKRTVRTVYFTNESIRNVDEGIKYPELKYLKNFFLIHDSSSKVIKAECLGNMLLDLTKVCYYNNISIDVTSFYLNDVIVQSVKHTTRISSLLIDNLAYEIAKLFSIGVKNFYREEATARIELVDIFEIVVLDSYVEGCSSKESLRKLLSETPIEE